jgi:hypothetical protein
MSYFLDHGLLSFVIAKLSLFIFPLTIIEWARKHRPVFAKMASRACIALYLFAYVSTVITLNQVTNTPNDQMVYSSAPVSATMDPSK